MINFIIKYTTLYEKFMIYLLTCLILSAIILQNLNLKLHLCMEKKQIMLEGKLNQMI
jgi:cell division protein FtsL